MSNKLEDIAKQYAENFYPIPTMDEKLYKAKKADIFRDGAEWQAEQDNTHTIKYLRSEQALQLPKMKALGVCAEGGTFEQSVNAVIDIAEQGKNETILFAEWVSDNYCMMDNITKQWIAFAGALNSNKYTTQELLTIFKTGL